MKTKHIEPIRVTQAGTKEDHVTQRVISDSRVLKGRKGSIWLLKFGEMERDCVGSHLFPLYSINEIVVVLNILWSIWSGIG